MVANRSETPPAGGDAAKGAPATEAHATAAAPAKAGGMAAWLPLLVAVVAMPILAYGNAASLS